MQIRTSLSRLLSQVTEIADALRPGLTLMKASSISAGATVLAVGQFEVFRRNLHRGARLADGLEIGARAEPGAGAVLVPFVEDQPGRRHQVQHRRHDVALEPRRGPLAIFGKAALILRPQAVHHEGKRPPAALGLGARRGCRAPPPPRRRRATTTAPARRSRTRRGHSAAGPAPRPGPQPAAANRAERDQKPGNPNPRK